MNGTLSREKPLITLIREVNSLKTLGLASKWIKNINDLKEWIIYEIVKLILKIK